jgi:hypothetical protein
VAALDGVEQTAIMAAITATKTRLRITHPMMTLPHQEV